MTTIPRFLNVLVLTVLSLAASAAAQSKLHMQRIGFKNGLVMTYLTLVEENGTPILGKSPRDFKLQIDGQRTEAALNLTSFVQTKEPIFVVAVVQLTPMKNVLLESLRSDIKRLAQAVGAIPESRVGLIGYGTDVKSLVELESSERVLSDLIKLTVDPPNPEAKSIDALRHAIDILCLDKGARKLVVHFSDGNEGVYDKKEFAGLGQRAELAGVVIDAIYYVPENESRQRKMSELSKRSHGVERYVHSAAEGDRKLADLSQEINEQYVITFDPTWTEPSHRLQVRLNAQEPIYGNIIEAKIPTCCSPLPPPKARHRWLWILLAASLLTAVFWLGKQLLRRGRR